MYETITDFSVVMPIHNESELLKLSLPSVYRLDPAETILLFDNCTDESYNVAVNIAKKTKFFEKTIFKEVSGEEGAQFSFRPTFLRRMGYSMAKCNKILKTDADLVLDPKIKKYIPLLGRNNVGIITFEYLDYPISYRHMIKRFLEKIKAPLPQNESWLGGNILFFLEDWKMAFSKRQEDENKKVDLTNIKRGEDTLFHKLLISEQHRKSVIVLTNTLHLRPVESPKRHYVRGQISWNVAKRSFPLILAQAIIFNRFNMIKGYLDAKKGVDRTKLIKS
ncbi:MAG: glycosyltransferase family 2 protein [Candidatus Bathyarchaeota archaeon]|nr:glycosyltransferase family 2 protein [Candidatus Bathyarchaeum sp.]